MLGGYFAGSMEKLVNMVREAQSASPRCQRRINDILDKLVYRMYGGVGGALAGAGLWLAKCGYDNPNPSLTETLAMIGSVAGGAYVGVKAANLVRRVVNKRK